jgi:hypothetical protein
MPPLWRLLAVVPATVVLIVGITDLPARSARNALPAEILQSELA